MQRVALVCVLLSSLVAVLSAFVIFASHEAMPFHAAATRWKRLGFIGLAAAFGLWAVALYATLCWVPSADSPI